MASGADLPYTDEELARVFRPFDGRRLALAVSGGIDSMTLLHLVARWLATRHGKLWANELKERAERNSMFRSGNRDREVGLPRSAPEGLVKADWIGADPTQVESSVLESPVVVLTIDHGLRPESRSEAAFVAETSRRLGFPHQTLVWQHDTQGGDAPALQRGMPPSTGIQEKARAARYNLLSDVIESEAWALFEAGDPGSSPLSPGRAKRAIVTAHHRDDLVETFLMRLKRGAGLDGLASIRSIDTLTRRPTTQRRYPTEVDLIRPLLDVPKSRLMATAVHLGLSWRDDPSNRNFAFERVRQREDMVALAELGFEAPALHMTIRRLQRASEFVEARIGEQVTEAFSGPRRVDLHDGLFASVLLSGPGHIGSDASSSLVDVHAESVQRILFHVISIFGGGAEPPGLGQIEELRRHFNKLAGQPSAFTDSVQAESGRTLAGCRLDFWRSPEVPDGRVRVWREAGRHPMPELDLQPGDGGWWDDRFAISLSPDAQEAVTIRALGEREWIELKRRIPALALWKGIPQGAPATLPAVWTGDRLIAVPYFERIPRTVDLSIRREIDHEWDARNGLDGVDYRAAFAPVARGT